MNISIICPSRGRPERLREMLDSAFITAGDPGRVTAEILVDASDPCLAEYIAQAPARAAFFVNDRTLSAPALYNELALRHAVGDLIVAASDDVIFTTPRWDDAIESLALDFPDGLFVGYFDDGRGRDKVEHFVTSKAWVKEVGYFMRPEYEHFSADEHVGAIAALAGRLRRLPEVVLDHRHKKYGKAENDETYQMKRRENLSFRDAARFKSFAAERVQAALRIRLAMARELEVAR